MQRANLQLVPLDKVVAPVRAQNRQLLVELSKWSLRNGEQLNPNTVAMFLGACQEWRTKDGFTEWKRIDVYPFIWAHTFNWCTWHGAFPPDDTPEQLWKFFHFLADTDRLTDTSDRLSALLQPLMCYGGLDRNGVKRPEGVPRPIPCLCYTPFRGRRHGEART